MFDYANDFFEDQEIGNGLGGEYEATEYYSEINYAHYDPYWDETLDFIVALPEKGDY